jgi:hypothetical protein
MRSSGTRAQNYRWVITSGVAYLAITAVWILLTVLTAPEGTVDQQLIALSKGSFLYRLSFLTASLATLPLLTLMVVLALFEHPESKPNILSILGALFLVPYVGLVSISYVSQCTLFPRLLADMSIVGASQVKIWYYNNPDSIPYLLDLLGLVFFSLSALAIGAKLVRTKGWLKAMGWLLVLSGLTGLLGFSGYVADNLLIESSIVLSGVLTVPLGLLAILWGAKQH